MDLHLAQRPANLRNSSKVEQQVVTTYHSVDFRRTQLFTETSAPNEGMNS
jgi:hypothetical protein